MSGMEPLIVKAYEAGLTGYLNELREACDGANDPWWQKVAADIDREFDRRLTPSPTAIPGIYTL
jgi:hypothetical protein